MTYTINKSDGTKLVDIIDGTIDETTDLKLIGKNSTTFGESLNEDLVHLLENFSNQTPPSRPLIGQLWYNTSKSRLEVYSGYTQQWRATGAPIIQESEPLNPIGGDFWISTRDRQLYFYDGSNSRVLAGPIWSQTQGVTGFKAETLYDKNGNSRPVLQLYVNDSLLGIYSAYEFTPVPALTGFNVISKGFTSVSRKFTSDIGATNSGTTITVKTTTNLEVGMTVSVIDGIGSFAPETKVTYVNPDGKTFIVSSIPLTPLTGGKTVVIGMVIATSFNVEVNNSQKLAGIDGGNYLRKDITGVMTGQLTVANNSGITIGSISNVQLKINGTALQIENSIASGDIAIRTKNSSSTVTNSIYITGSSGAVKVNGTFEVSGKILTKPIPLTLIGTETNAAIQSSIILILNDIANPSNYLDTQQALVHYQRITSSGNNSITRYLKRYKVTSGAWVFDLDLTSSV